jgi:hypothetical protein
MFKKIAIVLAVLIVGVLVFAATKPDTFHVERTATIAAPPERIQPLIADFRRWTEWSPWEKLDPKMQRTYSGTASGEGAIYEWAGDSSIGAGRMEIVTATPTEVDIKLDFIEPMQSSNKAKFVLTPASNATTVVWSMDGPLPYISKVMTVFVSMDTLLSKDFEKGLADLKAAAEKS